MLNEVLVGGAHLVARAAELQIRQLTTTALSATPTPSATASATSTDSVNPSSTNPNGGGNGNGSGGDNNNNNNNGGGGSNSNSGTSSPLLFFVALGFGVVFTNLWIIVGVKYCFRYNARNRRMMQAQVDENGEPLMTLPARPHRRRRDKKLMTMDEVNTKFPMVKYKSWVAQRAREGLPTAGGISVPPSRAASIRSVEGAVRNIEPVDPNNEKQQKPASGATDGAGDSEIQPINSTKNNTSDPAIMTAAGREGEGEGEGEGERDREADSRARPVESIHTAKEDDDDDEDDDAFVVSAVPPDLMGTSGDMCAICIEPLEDDDDVRGLACGHAFHAVCIDPWLTSRRASCPLCKADYYVPKPKAPPADCDPHIANLATADPQGHHSRFNMPQSPRSVRQMSEGFRGGMRRVMTGPQALVAVVTRTPRQGTVQAWSRRQGARNETTSTTVSRRPEPADRDSQQDAQQRGWLANVRARLPSMPFGARRQTPSVTPSNLEAGQDAAMTSRPHVYG